jgi:phospholipid/cholesterol/gamma-HCH transport system permease protein
MGSFLTMQAYFGATFTEGAGIVVGLGLIRNLAPLLTGFVLVGLITTKVTADLNGGARPGLDDPLSRPDRAVSRGERIDPRPVPRRGRLAMARILGAMIAGPILTLWGFVVGTMIGVLVARSMLGQSPSIFIGKIVEMLQPVDILGLGLKGMFFAGSTALIASFEGLRPQHEGGPDAHRAAWRSLLAVLLLNFTWFNLVYLAGDPFGPDVAVTSQ